MPPCRGNPPGWHAVCCIQRSPYRERSDEATPTAGRRRRPARRARNRPGANPHHAQIRAPGRPGPARPGDHRLRHPQPRHDGVRHAVRAATRPGAAAADGRGPHGRRGRPGLELTLREGCASTTARRCWRATWWRASGAGARGTRSARRCSPRPTSSRRRTTGPCEFRLKRRFDCCRTRWRTRPTPWPRSCRSAWPDPGDRAVPEIVGSGPFRYVAGERVAGSRNVYARFDRYVPRSQGTPASAPGRASRTSTASSG